MNTPIPFKKISAKTCPTCGKPGAEKTRPFCSVRCAQVDLGRWLKGGYSIPTDEVVSDGHMIDIDSNGAGGIPGDISGNEVD